MVSRSPLRLAAAICLQIVLEVVASDEVVRMVAIGVKQIRAAVRDDSFEKTLFDAWQKAVML